MFGMGMPEILLILAIALIVLGPKKLPEIAKALGRGIAEFKKATQDFKEGLDVDDDLKEARNTMREIKGDIEQGIRTSMAEGAAAVDNEAVSEEDLEHTFDEDVTEAPQEPVEDKSSQETEPKEPSKDA
jgi:TatA/E family protein of Tat protein translocase